LAQESEAQELVLGATNRRGKPIQCRVNCNPLKGSDQTIQGVILVIEELTEIPTTSAEKQDSGN